MGPLGKFLSNYLAISLPSMLLFLRQFKYLHLLLTHLLLFSIHSPYDARRVCSVPMLCPTLCETTDCSQPGSSVYGVFQARMLEWVAISSSRGSSQPRD